MKKIKNQDKYVELIIPEPKVVQPTLRDYFLNLIRNDEEVKKEILNILNFNENK